MAQYLVSKYSFLDSDLHGGRLGYCRICNYGLERARKRHTIEQCRYIEQEARIAESLHMFTSDRIKNLIVYSNVQPWFSSWHFFLCHTSLLVIAVHHIVPEEQI